MLTTVIAFKSPSSALNRVQENGFQGHSPKPEIRLNQVKKTKTVAPMNKG